MVKQPLCLIIVIWSVHGLYLVTYPIHQAPWISANVARWTWFQLHSMQSRTRQRLFHKRRVAHNASVPACRLPEELLLLIFDFVRSSGRFGEGLADLVHRINGSFNIVREVQAPPYIGDLRACSLVCRAWSTPATRVLLRHAPLRRLKDVVSFSSSAPSLASYVRRMDLPFIIREPLRDNMPRARRILYDLFRPIPFVPEYAEILPRHQNIHTLSIMAPHALMPVLEMVGVSMRENLRELRIIGAGSLVLNNLYSPDGLVTFKSLDTLHLQNAIILRPDAVQLPPPNLRCFSLEASTVTLPWLEATLRSTPWLRSLELRDITVHSSTPGVLRRILNSARYTSLERLVVCGIELKHLTPDTGKLRDMTDWTALKSLIIDDKLVNSLPRPPPNMVHLTFVYRLNLKPRRDRRSAILTDIANIKRTIERIQVDATSLGIVDLWYPMHVAQEWQTWMIAAFLLRDFVSRLGIELNINLMFRWKGERRVSPRIAKGKPRVNL